MKNSIESERSLSTAGHMIEKQNITLDAPVMSLFSRLWNLNLESKIFRDNYTVSHRERILTFFGRNVTDKVSNQKHFTMLPQITCASALPGITAKR